MPARNARKPPNRQPPAPTGIETLNEAANRYLHRVIEHADWITRTLEVWVSPPHCEPDAVAADGYCKVLLWLLRPTVQAGGQIDPVALDGYGVKRISLLSMLSPGVLGEDFPRATSRLFRLLKELPTDVWVKGQPPAANIVDDWRKATEMLRGCLASRLAAPVPATQPAAPVGTAAQGEQADGKAQEGDKPDDTGFVTNPLDKNAYRGASKILNDFPDRAPTYKDLTRILREHPEIRRWKPSRQRLCVHLGDWQKYVDSKSNTSSDGWSDNPADVETRTTQIRQNKARSTPK